MTSTNETVSSSSSPDPAPQLLAAFFDAASIAVAGLAGEEGFRCETSLEAFTGAGMTLVTPEEVSGRMFWAASAFETTRLTGSITYGDREFYINLVVGPRSHGGRGRLYGLWEWAQALELPDERADGGQFVVTVDRVRTLVRGLGEVFTKIWPRIADADALTVAAMDAARDRVHVGHVAAEAHREHEHVVVQAGEAFHSGDFVRAIALLERVRDRLTPAEEAKLRLARKYASASRPPRNR